MTAIQREALSFIELFLAAQGFSPTVREVAKHINRSVSATKATLDGLEKAGHITRLRGAPRTIRVVVQV